MISGFSDKRGESLADDLQIFLGDLCVEWGFCDALADDLIPGEGILTAETFATAVLAAEGWPEPERERKWRPRIEKLFIERYGAGVSVYDFPRRD